MVKKSLLLIACLSLSPTLYAKRFIVKFKENTNKSIHSFKVLRSTPKVEILELKDAEAEDLKESPDVEFIEEDTILKAYLTPSDQGQEDPLYYRQWHYQKLDLESAWDISVGSETVVVAVLDTGILPHQDLRARLIPGFDMVSDIKMANDGDGRDSDGTDPGDWVGSEDRCGFNSNSSWHGTHVAGTIAAQTGNGIGVAGVTWKTKVMPVRVLGKCGGYTSDIADGIKWAAGLQVSGLPLNPYPAKVINLSLGGQGVCGSYLQQAIDQATERGSLVVVAAGNSDQSMDSVSFSPANCKGVLTVGATNIDDDRAFYSNYGKRVDLMAPGGNNEYGILSTSNSGSTTAGSDSYVVQIGTSMATPHVSGLAALVFSVNKNLTAPEVKSILISTAKEFPFRSQCSSSQICGSGVANAFNALKKAKEGSPIDPPVEDGQDEIGEEPKPEPPPVEEEGSCGKTTETTKTASGFVFSLLFGLVVPLIRRIKGSFL